MSAQANYYAMRSVFELQLDAQLLEGLATIGHFDGKTPSLVCATNTQRLVIHTSENPGAEAVLRSGDETRSAENPVRTLNFGRTPTALAVGRLPDTSDRKDTDALYFGAATSLLAYDVDRNREYFYREVEDGVQAVACGVVNTARGPNGTGGVPTPLTIVGGNCTINGFDASGMESLWTVTGDQVTALMLMPWDSSEAPTVSAAGSGSGSSGDAGRPLSLVAASEDFELRVFDGEDTIASIMEADKVNQLVYSGIPGRFAYLSVNGTVGVYDRTERVWRAKGKHRPVAAAFCDVDFDGVPELVVGWSNGRVEVRGDDAEKRGVLFKERHAAPVSAVLAHDYRQNGQPLPIVCTVDGVVRGLELAGEQQQEEAVHGRETFKLDMLQRERQALAAELASVEEQLDRQRKGSSDVTLPQAGTVVRHKLLPNAKSGKLDVVFSVHHGYQDTIIQGCVLHSEAVFPGREYAFFAAEEPSGTLVCAIDVPRGAEARIAAAVMIGATNAENYQLHELTFAVPKFVTYQLWNPEATEPLREPAGHVTLQLPRSLRLAALGSWLAATFALPAAPDTSSDFSVKFVDTRDGSGLQLQGKVERHELQINGDTMEICGDVVESLAVTLVIEDASALCHFPEEMCELQETLLRVEEFNAVRLKLSSNMADAAASVKPLLIRAEDSRLISDISNMRRFYAQLYDLDKELIAENMKRCNNYAELKVSLKQANAYIMKAGRLRIGQSKTRLIAECRECVKAGDIRPLINLIRTGQR